MLTASRTGQGFTVPLLKSENIFIEKHISPYYEDFTEIFMDNFVQDKNRAKMFLEMNFGNIFGI